MLVPVIVQSERTECGLASLAMIAACHGFKTELSTLRRRFPDAAPTLRSLLSVADSIGLIGRPVRIESHELKKLKLPAIMHWGFSHFVVITHVRGRYVAVNDPAAGRRRLSWSEINGSFTGVAVEFRRPPGFVATQSPRLAGIAGFLRSLVGVRRYFAGMLSLLIVAQLLALVPPVATQLLIDEIVMGSERQWLHRILAGLGIVMLAGLLIDSLRRYVAIYTGMHLSLECTTAVVRHLLSLPVITIARRSVGDLVSRLDSLRPIELALTDIALRVVMQCTVLIATCGLMLAYDWRLATIAIVALCTIAAIQALSLPRSKALTTAALLASARAKNSVIETLRGYTSVAALGLSPQRLAHWQHGFSHAVNANAERQLIALYTGVGHGIINVFEHVVFLAVGLGAVLDKQVTLGVLFAFMTLRGRLHGAAADLVVSTRELFLVRAHIERIAEIVDEDPIAEPPSAAFRQPLIGRIECVDIVFAYPGRRLVIDSLCLSITDGESVAICGPSGAGKSTLLMLIAGMLDPRSGFIRYDGLDHSHWDRRALQSQFGVVLQTDRLFEGSVVDNVSGFDTEPDLERIRDALSVSAIWDDMTSLSMGLHTPITSAGLSGGQVQRLLLARALYRQPRVLFLDEATSNLDRATEARVVGNLGSLDCTIVSVAHRRNAIAQAGRVVQLKGPMAIRN